MKRWWGRFQRVVFDYSADRKEVVLDCQGGRSGMAFVNYPLWFRNSPLLPLSDKCEQKRD